MDSAILCQGSVSSEKLGSVLRSWRKRKGLFKDLDPPQNSDSCIKGSADQAQSAHACHPRALAGFPNGLFLTAVELGAGKHCKRHEKPTETEKGSLREELKVPALRHTPISRQKEVGRREQGHPEECPVSS